MTHFQRDLCVLPWTVYLLGECVNHSISCMSYTEKPIRGLKGEDFPCKWSSGRSDFFLFFLALIKSVNHTYARQRLGSPPFLLLWDAQRNWEAQSNTLQLQQKDRQLIVPIISFNCLLISRQLYFAWQRDSESVCGCLMSTSSGTSLMRASAEIGVFEEGAFSVKRVTLKQ